nr:flagellar hook-length control protein FliK [Caldimonas sp.]
MAFGARDKAAVDAVDERDLAAASGPGQRRDPHAEATFTSALGDRLRAAEPSLAHTPSTLHGTALPVGGSGIASVATGSRDVASPPAALALATPIDSPDFAAALGVQVSVLARDGVQHAELHLHPVETGPVSIRIELDGTNARIDFGADLAATRHAIEQGLPELASALRDAGLTLAGGGVSQHAGSRPRGDDDGSGAARAQVALPATGAAPARVAQPRVAAGGVDVYA